MILMFQAHFWILAQMFLRLLGLGHPAGLMCHLANAGPVEPPLTVGTTLRLTFGPHLHFKEAAWNLWWWLVDTNWFFSSPFSLLHPELTVVMDASFLGWCGQLGEVLIREHFVPSRA